MTNGKETNDKDPKSKVGDHERISKYKNVSAKGYVPNWSEEVFSKTHCEKSLEHFTKNNCKKQIIKSLQLKE